MLVVPSLYVKTYYPHEAETQLNIYKVSLYRKENKTFLHHKDHVSVTYTIKHESQA